MAGRPDYQTLTATLPSKSQLAFLQQPATDVAAGASEQVTFYSPAGTLVTVTNASMTAQGISAATSGTHELRIFGPDQVDYTKGVSNYADPVSYATGFWQDATATGGQYPPAQAGSDQSWFLKAGVLCDATVGIGIIYYNDTNASQGQARFYLVTGTEEDLP